MHLSTKDGLCDFRLKTGCCHVFKGERHFQGGGGSSTSVSAAATSSSFFFYCSAYLEKSLFLSLCPSSTQVPELVFATGGKASLLITSVLWTVCLTPHWALGCRLSSYSPPSVFYTFSFIALLAPFTPGLFPHDSTLSLLLFCFHFRAGCTFKVACRERGV